MRFQERPFYANFLLPSKSLLEPAHLFFYLFSFFNSASVIFNPKFCYFVFCLPRVALARSGGDLFHCFAYLNRTILVVSRIFRVQCFQLFQDPFFKHFKSFQPLFSSCFLNFSLGGTSGIVVCLKQSINIKTRTPPDNRNFSCPAKLSEVGR